MKTRHVLIVEDEADLQEVLRFNLQKEGFTTSSALTGEEGLALARKKQPDLILLDLMLPGLDGLEICRQLKKNPATEKVPIIILTAKGEDPDIVAGLELGADDYITKPFSPKVLIARLRAVLRRRERPVSMQDEVIRIHGLIIDAGRHEVSIDGEPAILTATEFKLIQLLASRPGWVFTRDQIINAVRGEEYGVTDRAVDVQILGLRRKLGAAGHYIETVRGVGYRLKD